MLFDKLANVITKHYKKVLIAWTLILIISVPAILQVNEVVSYANTGVTSGDYESVKANEIIISEFQGSVANGTILIVLQSDDVTDAPSRDYVLSLQDKILSSTELNDFTGTTSAYTINSMVMSQTILALGPTMRPAEQQVNSTAFLLWGVPAIHVSNWVISYSDSDQYPPAQVQVFPWSPSQCGRPPI